MNALDLLQQYLRRAALADNLDANSLAVLRSGGGGMFRDNRDTVERAPGQSDQGYLGGQLHPNALGIYGQPRQPPAGDEVIRSGQSYSAPIGMPTTLMPTTLQQWFNQGARGMQPISSPLPPDDMAWLDRALQNGAALRPPALPEGLPDVVRQSILNKPSYSEQSNIPRRINPGDYSDFDVEFNQRDPYERERLSRELDFKSEFPQMDFPVPEGAWAARTQQSPYPSPLNQMMPMGRRSPLALY